MQQITAAPVACSASSHSGSSRTACFTKRAAREDVHGLCIQYTADRAAPSTRTRRSSGAGPEGSAPRPALRRRGCEARNRLRGTFFVSRVNQPAVLRPPRLRAVVVLCGRSLRQGALASLGAPLRHGNSFSLHFQPAVGVVDPNPTSPWRNNYGVWVDEFEARRSASARADPVHSHIPRSEQRSCFAQTLPPPPPQNVRRRKKQSELTCALLPPASTPANRRWALATASLAAGTSPA